MISPSALNAWETCGRKLAFQRDPATSALNKPTPRTALGLVAHGLTQLAATGQPPAGTTRRAWLEQQWEQLLDQQVQKLATAWPGRRIPPVAQWDGLVATRVRILRKLSANPEPQTTTTAQAPATTGPGLPWIERRLEDPTARVFGTPDRVDVRNGQLRVVDLKSGVHQANIQDGQRRQLLIYAHLVDVACGQLPGVGVIEDVSGKETSFAIESVAVTQALHEARRAVSNFNDAIASGEVPAHPEVTACRFCPFRSVCWPYWASDAHSDRDVRGTVIDQPEGSSFKVDVGAAEALRVVITAGVSVPGKGDEVVILDVDPAGHNTVKMRWNSALRTPE